MTTRTNPHLWAVIMAGGSGTRFWPVSRRARPKQFLPPGGGIPASRKAFPGGGATPEPSLLELTLARLEGLVPPERTLIMASEAHEKLQKKVVITEEKGREKVGIPAENVIYEPQKRNTGPCLGLAARLIEARAPGAVICALPADHAIAGRRAFQNLITFGAGLATGRDAIVALGLTPRSPETGFGYIERGEPIALPEDAPAGGAAPKETAAFGVKCFAEKPSLARAKAYAESGEFYWNSGIYILKAARVSEELEAHCPRLASSIREAAGAYREGDTAAFARHFGACEPISIDRAVMEKTRGLIVVPADSMGWSDLGSWPALRDVMPRDEAGNLWMLAPGSRSESLDAENLIVRSNKRLVAAIGVRDLILVETDDALLICSGDSAGRIGEMVKNLNQSEFS